MAAVASEVLYHAVFQLKEALNTSPEQKSLK